MKALQPFIRGCIMCGIIINANVCYYFFNKAGDNMNAGIITSLFTTATVWTTVLFYCIYGQRVSAMQLVGIGFIIGSVFIISFGGQKAEKFEETETVNELYFTLAIMAGLTVGLF